jgi:hypothetical protein
MFTKPDRANPSRAEVMSAFVESGLAHGIRQSGIRIDADGCIADLASSAYTAHERRAERAVQPYGDGLRVPHGIPERSPSGRGCGQASVCRHHDRVAPAAFSKNWSMA